MDPKDYVSYPIYVFGFSRNVVNEAFEAFMENEGTSEDAQNKLEALFGKKPYSFINPELMHLCAPLKEFSTTTLSKNVLDRVFSELPDYLKLMLENLPRGFFVDGMGRSYKHEYGNVWSVYFPFNLRKRYSSGNLYEKNILKLTHTTLPDTSFLVKIESIGDQKIASFSVIFEDGPWIRALEDLKSI